MTPQELKEKHADYLSVRSKKRQPLLRFIFPLEELALHLLLEAEAFYVKDERTMNYALKYLQGAYPEATIDDLERVYELYKNVVSEVYG